MQCCLVVGALQRLDSEITKAMKLRRSLCSLGLSIIRDTDNYRVGDTCDYKISCKSLYGKDRHDAVSQCDIMETCLLKDYSSISIGALA